VIVEAQFTGKFTRRPTHGNNRSAVAHTNVHVGEQASETVRCRFDENDFGLRGDRMRPGDIKRYFDAPVGIGRRLATIGIYLPEATVLAGASRQTELAIKKTPRSDSKFRSSSASTMAITWPDP
jgi:hypothetical protein